VIVTIRPVPITHRDARIIAKIAEIIVRQKARAAARKTVPKDARQFDPVDLGAAGVMEWSRQRAKGCVVRVV
jgi:hypothetical protein